RPTIKLLTRKVTAGKPIRVSVHDAGAGVDRSSLYVALGGKLTQFSYANGTLSIPTSKAAKGRVLLTIHAADNQELKNMEDVGPVLPNTHVLHAFVKFVR